MTNQDVDGAEDGARAAGLRGKRVLVVEDETIVAMLIEDILGDLGAAVVGPVGRSARALDLLGSEPVDAAILDVNLGGETTLSVARELRRRGVPFVFATGYGASGVPEEFAGQPFLQKPFRESELGEVLARAVALGA